MQEYPCAVCKEPLNIGMCQSGILVKGVSKPAHVHCSDAWAAERIDVWRVISPGNGSYVEEFVGNVAEMLKEMDDGSSYVIEKTTMTRAEYEALEEFQGF